MDDTNFKASFSSLLIYSNGSSSDMAHNICTLHPTNNSPQMRASQAILFAKKNMSPFCQDFIVVVVHMVHQNLSQLIHLISTISLLHRKKQTKNVSYEFSRFFRFFFFYTKFFLIHETILSFLKSHNLMKFMHSMNLLLWPGGKMHLCNRKENDNFRGFRGS